MTECKLLHLGCGEEYREGWHNVDNVASVNPDEVLDLEETPWPWPDNSAGKIEANHVFEHLDNVEAALRECARVLIPGGRLELTLPMGINAIADPDHTRLWTWRTPLFYCGERHWDVDVGLSVVDRSVDLHTHYSGLHNTLAAVRFQVLKAIHGPGEWCFNQPGMSGEFRVVFENDC